MKTKLSIVFLLFLFSSQANGQWEATGITATVYSFADKDSTIFASTANGVILSTNNGSNWLTPANAGLTNTYARPLAFLDDTLLVGTFGDGVFRSTTSAASWTQDSGLKSQIVDDMTVNGNSIFIACEDGIFRSMNDSIHGWTEVHPDFVGFHGITTIGSIIFAANDNGVLLSSDKGGSWNQTGSVNASFILALRSIGMNLFAGTSDGVFISSDNSNNWAARNKGLTNKEVHSIAHDGSTIFVGTANGVFYSTDNAMNWTLAGLNGTKYGTVYSLGIKNGYLLAGCLNGVYRRAISSFGINDVHPVSMTVCDLNNYPNPFSNKTTIIVSNTDNQFVDVGIINLLGEQCTHLFSGDMNEGKYSFEWDATSMSPGVYFCVVTTKQEIVSIPMIKNGLYK